MSLDNFKTIDIDLTNANEAIPPIRLNAGDIDGRKITVRLYDGAASVNETDVKSAELAWNQDIANPASAGGYVAMSKGTSGGTVAFTATIPRELLLDPATNDRVCTLGVILHDAAGTTVTRNITAIIEPSVLNASAPDILDPLKELHNAANTATTAAQQAQQAVTAANSAVERVNDVMDGAEAQANSAKASADAAAQSATSAQSAAQQASTAVSHASEYAQAAQTSSDSASTFARSAQSAAQQAVMAQNKAFEAVNGFGITSLSVDYTQHPVDTPTAEVEKVEDTPGQYTVALHLSHPQTISQIAVTTLEPDAQATADFDTDADGNLIVTLGIPKGRPGEGGAIATADVAGAVKPGKALAVRSDGTLDVDVGNGIDKTYDMIQVKTGDGLAFDSDGGVQANLGYGLQFDSMGGMNSYVNQVYDVNIGSDSTWYISVYMPSIFTPQSLYAEQMMYIGICMPSDSIANNPGGDTIDNSTPFHLRLSTPIGVSIPSGTRCTLHLMYLDTQDHRTLTLYTAADITPETISFDLTMESGDVLSLPDQTFQYELCMVWISFSKVTKTMAASANQTPMLAITSDSVVANDYTTGLAMESAARNIVEDTKAETAMKQTMLAQAHEPAKAPDDTDTTDDTAPETTDTTDGTQSSE